MLTIGDAEGPGALINQPLYTQVDSNGRFWLTAGTIPQIFDRNGKFLSLAGKKGRGPGEFLRGVPMAPVGDSMVILDAALGRAIIMRADRSGFRTISMPPGLDNGIVISWPDLVVHSGSVPTPDRFGYAIHSVSYAGSRVALSVSTSPVSDEVRPGEPPLSHLLSLSTANGTFWTSEVYAYRFAQWDRNLRTLKLFERKPRWWRRKPAGPLITRPDRAPDPYVAAIATDESGRVWMFLHVAADKWQEAWPEEVRGKPVSGAWIEANTGKVEYHKLRSTLIEVIDPVKGAVLARAKIKDPLIATLPGSRGVLYTPTDDGIPQITIVQLSLSRR